MYIYIKIYVASWCPMVSKLVYQFITNITRLGFMEDISIVGPSFRSPTDANDSIHLPNMRGERPTVTYPVFDDLATKLV